MRARAARGSATSFFQDAIEIDARHLQRWKKSEEDTGSERDDHREQQHRHVQIESYAGWHRRWNQRPQRCERPVSQKNSESASGRRKQDALRQKLPSQPRTASAQRSTNRDFPLPRRATSQQNVSHIHAGNQKQQRNGADQKQKSGPRGTGEIVMKSHKRRAHRLFVFTVLLPEAAGDRLGFRLRLPYGNRGFEPRDDIEIMRVADIREIFQRIQWLLWNRIAGRRP